MDTLVNFEINWTHVYILVGLGFVISDVIRNIQDPQPMNSVEKVIAKGFGEKGAKRIVIGSWVLGLILQAIVWPAIQFWKFVMWLKKKKIKETGND